MKFILVFILGLSLGLKIYAQDSKPKIYPMSIGLNYGSASQDNFISNNYDYLYENRFFKLQISYPLYQKKLQLELLIEPSVYYSKHQLLNSFFIVPESGPDFIERRELFTQKRSFEEYALNIGIVVRYPILDNLNTYILGSVGPMISNDDTERLKKGFAFSDILGFGINFIYERLIFDVRLTLRHNSNANLSQPNHGHNSVGIESGIAFKLY
jgi:hypothetical protein